MKIRVIENKDNSAIAKIIRENLKAHQLDIPGTAYFDAGLDHLSDYYLEDPKHRGYFVLVDDSDVVAGGIGFAEFDGKENCAEMQKLYISDSVKGQGLGYELVRLVEENAKKAGYETLYLETHTNLEAAIHLYEKTGFREIERPASVMHGTMNKFYEKRI